MLKQIKIQFKCLKKIEFRKIENYKRIKPGKLAWILRTNIIKRIIIKIKFLNLFTKILAKINKIENNLKILLKIRRKFMNKEKIKKIIKKLLHNYNVKCI